LTRINNSGTILLQLFKIKAAAKKPL